MFVHFGGRKWASLSEMVGVFTLDTIKSSAVNEEYLRHIEDGTGRDFKEFSSVIILEGKKAFYSSICSLTLIKRIQDMEKKIASTNCGVK